MAAIQTQVLGHQVKMGDAEYVLMLGITANLYVGAKVDDVLPAPLFLLKLDDERVQILWAQIEEKAKSELQGILRLCEENPAVKTLLQSLLQQKSGCGGCGGKK